MAPHNHKQTVRQQIIELLRREESSQRDISQALSIPEKEAVAHLDHIERTIRTRGEKLVEIPHECLDCGFVFEKRARFSKPGRCPKCKNSHIQTARYYIK